MVSRLTIQEVKDRCTLIQGIHEIGDLVDGAFIVTVGLQSDPEFNSLGAYTFERSKLEFRDDFLYLRIETVLLGRETGRGLDISEHTPSTRALLKSDAFAAGRVYTCPKDSDIAEKFRGYL